MDHLPVREGDLLAGKYRIQKVLGQGGMGVVVAAVHAQLGQLVAVKFLLPEACAHPEAVGRFLREARAAVHIQSEHVARVLDVGELETGAPYIVMEYLRGSDLGDVVETSGPLSVADAVDYVTQACEAIAEAHALGIVHRDLKPRNLFLTRRPDGSGFVKVIDFGISKATQDGVLGDSGSLTATSAMLGSPRYMSPEQLRSAKTVDRRTDIWALGVVLFEILTNQAVFMADTLPGLITAIGMDPPPPLRTVRADAPIELERIILRCLEKDPARRFSDVGGLALALAALGGPQVKLSAQRTVSILRAAGMTGGAVTAAEGHAAGASAAGPVPASAGTGVSWGGTGGASGASRSGGRLAIAIVAAAVVGAAGAAVFFVARAPVAAPQAASIVVSMPSVDRPTASAAPAATHAAEPAAIVAPDAPASVAASPAVSVVQAPRLKSQVRAAPAKPAASASAPKSATPTPADRGADPF